MHFNMFKYKRFNDIDRFVENSILYRYISARHLFRTKQIIHQTNKCYEINS